MLLTYFIPIVRLFLHNDFHYELLLLLDQDIALTMVCQQGILTPPRQLIPPRVCSMVPICPTFNSIFFKVFLKIINAIFFLKEE